MADVDPQNISAALTDRARSRSASRGVSRSPTAPPAHRPGVVPMTGTITRPSSATIIRMTTITPSRVHLEGTMRAASSAAATLSTISGRTRASAMWPPPHAASRRWAFLCHNHARRARRARRADDACGSYRYPEIETKVAGDAVVLPLIGEVRAAASVVASTRAADITSIDFAAAPRRSPAMCVPTSPTACGPATCMLKRRMRRNCRNRFRRHGASPDRSVPTRSSAAHSMHSSSIR